MRLSGKLELSRYKVLSLDLFDTLFVRLVEHPTDVFKILGNVHGIENFYEQRIFMEQLSREKKYRSEGHHEVNLTEIYEGNEYLLESELRLEMSLIKINDEILDLLNDARKLGLCIVFTSDTYFNERFLKVMFRKLSVPMPEKMFISSELGKSKAMGDVYPELISDLGLSPSEILHVGDNYQSDIENSKIHKIKSYHYRRNYPESSYKIFHPGIRNNLDKYILNAVGMWSKEKRFSESYWFNIGYEVAGPLIVAQAEWIKQEVSKTNITKVLFVARDGFLIKEIWDRSYHGNRQAVYLETSRLLLIKLLAESNFEKFEKQLLRHLRSSLKDVLCAYGLLQLAESYGEFSDKELKQVLASRRIQRKFSSFLWARQSEIIHIYEEGNRIHRKYLSKSICKTSTLGFVDLGWAGTTQELLEDLYQIEIQGFYWGIWPWRYSERRKAFGFSRDANPTLFSLAKHCVEIFEYMFSAPHGTILKTKRSAEGTEEVSEFAVESEASRLNKLDIQRGVVSFFDDIEELIGQYNFLSNPHLVATKASALILDPTLEDLQNFGQLHHSLLPGDSASQTLIFDNGKRFPLWIRGEMRALTNQNRITSYLRLLRLGIKEFGYFGLSSLVYQRILRRFKK
jgi:predicted HAD superfamily hydrolase